MLSSETGKERERDRIRKGDNTSGSMSAVNVQVGEAIIIKRILLWRSDIVLRIINEIAYTLI